MELATKLELVLKLRQSMALQMEVISLIEGEKPLIKLETPKGSTTKTVLKAVPAPAPAPAPKGYKGGWPEVKTAIGTEFRYVRKGNGKTVTFKVTGWDARKGRVLAQRA